jgi:hypothetical protein
MSGSLEIQKAIVALLATSAQLKALIGDPPRIFDSVPHDPTFPYVTMGDAQELVDSADQIEGQELFLDLHVWSRAKGKVEAKQIAALLRGLLIDPNFAFAQGAFVFGEVTDVRHLTDPDGLTAHTVLTFQALTEDA